MPASNSPSKELFISRQSTRFASMSRPEPYSIASPTGGDSEPSHSNDFPRQSFPGRLVRTLRAIDLPRARCSSRLRRRQSIRPALARLMLSVRLQAPSAFNPSRPPPPTTVAQRGLCVPRSCATGTRYLVPITIGRDIGRKGRDPLGNLRPTDRSSSIRPTPWSAGRGRISIRNRNRPMAL